MQAQAMTGAESARRERQTSTRGESYRPPKPGAGFNDRLAADVQKRFRGDVRFQIVTFCKHCAVPAEQAATPQDENRVRSEMSGVVNDSVTALIRCGIRVQEIDGLSQRNLLTAVRFWHQQGHAPGTVRWRVAVLRSFNRVRGRHMPLLRDGSREV